MHLVGFIIRICHDARSPERQICIVKCMSLIRDGYLASDIKKKNIHNSDKETYDQAATYKSKEMGRKHAN